MGRGFTEQFYSLPNNDVNCRGYTLQVKQYKFIPLPSLCLQFIPLEDHYNFAILWRDVIKRDKLSCHEHILRDVKLALVWLGILSL